MNTSTQSRRKHFQCVFWWHHFPAFNYRFLLTGFSFFNFSLFRRCFLFFLFNSICVRSSSWVGWWNGILCMFWCCDANESWRLPRYCAVTVLMMVWRLGCDAEKKITDRIYAAAGLVSRCAARVQVYLKLFVFLPFEMQKLNENVVAQIAHKCTLY